MSHNFLSLYAMQFDARSAFGGLINIGGETRDCRIEITERSVPNSTYTVFDRDTGEELCFFRAYHLSGGPTVLTIEEVSRVGGNATLILNEPEWSDGDDEMRDECC